MALLEIQEGFGREHLRKAHPLGPICAELQDHVEALDTAFAANTDIAANTAAIAVNAADIEQLQDDVQDPTTGLLDRATALETHQTQLQGSFKDIVPISFKANEIGQVKVFFPAKATITKLRFFTTLALAGTDAGTVTAKNAAGTAMANGALSIPASSAFAYEPAAVVPTTNNVVSAASFIILESAKTTAGGTGFCTVEYTITP